MSEVMKEAYRAAGELQYFFDVSVPVDLWRGLKRKDLETRVKALRDQGREVPATLAREVAIEPITVGFWIVTSTGRRWRAPDVEVFTRNGQPWIKGCRTTRQGGQHWGISLWDRQPDFAARGGWQNFRVPKGTPIPAALAVTQDDDHGNRANHYSIAPKDDMPLGLYVEWLKEMSQHFQEWK
jgi:Tse2-like ADP-ribosyltransferase toxin